MQYDPDSSEHWREQAVRARRLAKVILNLEVADRLNEMAEEFDAQAAIIEAEPLANQNRGS